MLAAIGILIAIVMNTLPSLNTPKDNGGCELPRVPSADGTRCECVDGNRGLLCELEARCNFRGMVRDNRCSCDGVFNKFEGDNCSCPMVDGKEACCGPNGTLIESKNGVPECRCAPSYGGTNCQHRYVERSKCPDCPSLPESAASAEVTCKPISNMAGGICFWSSVGGDHSGQCTTVDKNAVLCKTTE